MSEKKWLVVILVVAAVTRLGAALYLGDQVEALPGIYDQISYDTLATSLLQGQGYSFPTAWWPATEPSEPTSFWSFLYPLYLSAVYAVAGHHPLIARIVQGLITGPITAWLLYLLGRRLFNPVVGLAAAAISSIYVYFIYYQAALMTEPFYIAAILGALVLALEIVERPSWGRWLALGSVLGIAILLRQALLLFVPFLLGWVLWTGRKKIRPWALLLPVGIILLMVVPWTLRNYLLFDRFVLLNTNSGFAFFWANHPIHGTYSALLEGTSYQDLIPTELRSLNEAALDAELLRRGLGFVWADPGRYILLCLNRTFEHFKFWPSAESGLISNISRVGSFGLFLPFMLYGLVVSLRRWRHYLLLYLFIIVYCAIHLLTWAGIRYRLPVDAVLLPFAGLAIVDLARRVWKPRRTAAMGDDRERGRQRDEVVG